MKPENERLGRCKTCRYWRSFSEVLSERVGASPSPAELDAARRRVRLELSPNNLAVVAAESRGWCLAAERGGGTPSTILAVNMVDQNIVRMVTTHIYGCLNYQPRPSQALVAPAPDFSGDERLGRCAGCTQWSDALNEANALFAQDRLTNPASRIEDGQREAMALLSPPPLKPETAMLRGWCKIASLLFPFAMSLSVDPETGAVGGLITSRDHACVRFSPITSPDRKTRPGWRLMAQKLHERYATLGPSASLDSLLFSYMDPATLIDPAHPLSPLHKEHPFNRGNAMNLRYNPVPAFAAYILNSSLANTLSDRAAIQQGPELGRKAGVEDKNRPRVSMLFSSDPSLVQGEPSQNGEELQRVMLAQARLAQDFSERTIKIGSETGEEIAIRLPVSLTKVSDVRGSEPDEGEELRKRRQRPVIGHGFTDRRRTLE